jgi:iron complex transport system substrate-binding protein
VDDHRSLVGWGAGEDEEAGAILKVFLRPWGFFIFSALKTFSSCVLVTLNACDVPRKVRLGASLLAALLEKRFERGGDLRWIVGLYFFLIFSSAHLGLSDSDMPPMKRRQQGILTGMPFMANIASRTFVDDAGRKLFIAKAPNRVISLAPSITEMLFALELDEQIVGVTEFCNYPPAALLKPKIGYARPNLESLIALRPDLIVAPQEFLRADMQAKLEQLKIPVFLLGAKSVEDIFAQIQSLGKIFNRVSMSDHLTRSMRDRIAEVTARIASSEKKRVLYVLNSHPLITVGPGSYIHQMIGLAGGINIAAGSSSSYPRLNIETVLKEDPEVLIFPVGSNESIPKSEQEEWNRWNSLSAVRNRQLRNVSSDALNRPGPRVVEGLEHLARVIHPEAYVSDTTSPRQ